MDSCKILNVDAFIDDIINICEEAYKKSNSQAAEFVTLKINQLIQDARNTNEPENQINLLKQALQEFYDSAKKEDEYGIYLSSVFPENSINRLLDSNYNSTLDQTLPASFAGMVNSSSKLKQDNFVEERFYNAPSAKLFFERQVKLDLVKTFLVSREKGEYYTTIEQINRNVQEYKQELLNRIFKYFDNPLFKNLIPENVNKSLYEDGTYTGTLEKLTSTFDSKLDPKHFYKITGIKSLESYYQDYKIHESEAAKQFLDAYNAWIILQNFDTVVDIYFSSVIKISNENINQHDFKSNKYRLRTKSANKYQDWSSQEKELEDIGDVISDVTQLLIETSKRYQWKSDNAYQDRFLSFQDYNYVIGFIKKLIFSKKIEIKKLDLKDKQLHNSTKNLIKEIEQLNGNISFQQIISLLNDNPQKYLPAIFDLLCNYLIEDGYISPIPSNIEKDLIWSVYKEIFQHDNTSLYGMHIKTPINKVYPTITQATISIFSEDRMQYYEEENNTFNTRLLSNYALENTKRSIFQNIQETALGLTSKDLANLNIKDIISEPNENGERRITKCEITISSPELQKDFIITSTDYAEEFKIDDNSHAQSIWYSDSFQLLIKKLLGIDFQSNIDLAEAYLMQWKMKDRYINAVNNISTLLGRVAFTINVNQLADNLSIKAKGENKLHNFLTFQYGDISKANQYINSIDKSNGNIPVLPSDKIDISLKYLIEAYALNENTVTAPQAKTGEGTSISNYTLSCLHASYPYQIETQCKSKTSAVKDLTFVQNTNGMFGKTLSEREVKAFNTTTKAIDFSDTQAFQFDFLLSFIRSFIPNKDTKNVTQYGKCLITPTVNSDKSWLGKLEVFTTAESHIAGKSYLQLTNGELEQEIKYELAPVYSSIFDNIQKELFKIVQLFDPTIINTIDPTQTSGEGQVLNTMMLLDILNNQFKNDTTLGNNTKTRIVNGLSQLITTYNNTHVNNPIELADQIHYCFDADGLLQVNNTLLALWARTNIVSINDILSNYLRNYINNLLQEVSTLSSFFAYQDYKTIEDLLSINFKIRLWGSDDLVKHEQPEIKFLRGDTSIFQRFADSQILINACTYLGQNWVDPDGTMIIAKRRINGQEINIKTKKDLQHASSIVLHPMLAKFNRLGYLASQQYTLATVGSHYIHGKPNEDIIKEESNRQLAANKRNNALTATIYQCQRNQLDGLPNTLRFAIMDDTTYDLYNVMGGMYYKGHKPMDGGMPANAFIPDLVNNSLNGERVGNTQKLFGTFYNEKYAAGGTIKTASFPANNEKMRNYPAWRFLQQNMSDRVWVSENSNEDNTNIEEQLNITMDYLGNPINYSNILSSPIYYKRDVPNSDQTASYKLKSIEYLGNNQYKITEHEVDIHGVEVFFDENNNPIKDISRIVKINSNWKLYTEVFGGYNSQEIGNDGKLTWSENSIALMQYAINNIGKVRKPGEYKNPITGQKENYYYDPINEKEALNDYVDSLDVGLDQQIVWQPLKYSDVHFIPNIGAIKSAQFNVNYNAKEILSKPTTLNFFTIPLAQFGVQLDKEHHADEGEVSFPTQIGTAIANRSFTDNMEKYSQAVATLTKQIIEPYISNIDNKGALIEKVSDLVVNNLIHSHKPINSILDPLVEKIKSGKELDFQNNIEGKIGFSDRTIINQVFSILSSELTNSGIKLKLPGSLAVINPSDPVIHLYGDRLLGSLTQPTNESNSTRTLNEQAALAKFQESVKQGKETDSYGDNMLIFDLQRDNPIQLESESIQNYAARLTKMRLSNISKIKTQHNYIVEFADGHTEEITINTPDDQYVKLKNLITKKLYTEKPLNYNKLLNDIHQQNLQNTDLSTTKESIIASYLSGPILLKSSIAKELGYKINSTEINKLFRITLSKEKGGVSIERLSEDIHAANLGVFKDDWEVRTLIIDALGSAETPGAITNWAQNSILKQSEQEAWEQYNQYVSYIQNTYGLEPEEYEKAYYTEYSVVKVYENVQKGRGLSAYNVQFQDDEGYAYQLYDLDSVSTLFTLNRLLEKPLKGYKSFSSLSQVEQQDVINSLLKSKSFQDIIPDIKLYFDNIPNYQTAFANVSKTQTFNVELPTEVSEFKSYAKNWKLANPSGIIAYRKYGNNIKSFTPETAEEGWIGNPFTVSEYGKGVATEKFYLWLVTGNNFGNEQATEEFRGAIIQKILNTPKSTPILYYTELNRPSHANVIDYLIHNKELLINTNSIINTPKIITYIPKGKTQQTYTIIGNKIFNQNNKEVFKEDSVDRNKIFANLAIKEKRAVVIDYKDKKYVVNNRDQIISGATGKIMQWGDENGDRKEILKLAKEQFNKINEFKGNQSIPEIDKDFIKNLNPEQISKVAADIERIARPRIYAKMQEDLFKLSPDYQGEDKRVCVNHVKIIPQKIKILPYEQIAPKMYKTQFGLDQFDDLQTILKDEDFFIKRGVNRFACKLADHQYDFELKNFNGNHYYILKAEDIPQELSSNFIKPNTINKGGEIYRTDHNGQIMYKLSSENDLIGYIGNVEVIITENPLSYLQTLNFNTLKVSPKRVTDESYKQLIEAQEGSTRDNSINFLKAITKKEGRYLSLEEFKQFNIDLDSITYENVKFKQSIEDNKSIAQICKILNKTGREMHTSFKASLEMTAGRIPAQSQQSFMISRTIAFIDEDVNNVYVSPFQLFLQGSDLDIDAVTLIGYAFDMHGKFIGWSPYFQLTSTDLFEVCKKIPLPTGQEQEIQYGSETNFFEVYSKYFGTLFKNSIADDGNLELNEDGSPVLYIDVYTTQGLELLAEFLKDFNKYGISIEAGLTEQGKLYIENVEEFYKNGESLFNNLKGVKYEHVQSIMTQLLNFANRHNTYCIQADEYARKDMVKNFLSYQTYLTAANPANQTEAMDSIDASTQGVKSLATKTEKMKAPGNEISKRLSIGEGQAGKQGVGIGAVGIKANSTIQYYLRKLMKEGTKDDKKRILFKPFKINGKEYKGFANMYKDLTLPMDENLEKVFEYIDQFTSPDQIPEDAFKNIAAMLSVAVDNAKDLVLGAINAGPKLMGLYIYGLAIGVPIEYLGKLMQSTQGLILKELTENSIFNNDNFSFKVLDVFKKLHGEIAQDLSKYDVYIKDTLGKTVSIQYQNGNTTHKIKTPADALWAAMSSKNSKKTVYKAIEAAIRNRQFSDIWNQVQDHIKVIKNSINNLTSIDENTRRNWNCSFNQMINFIKDIKQKSLLFNQDSTGYELRMLAEGAKEMRILGQLLGINKGLKSSINDMEQFIETFENLIINRKPIGGDIKDRAARAAAKAKYKIDFKKFLYDEDYAQWAIDEYESAKHSINILDVLSKVEYIKSYLQTQAIPYYFLNQTSIAYRTKRKYIQAVNEIPIFEYFNVYDSTSKDQILAGLDNLIHYKLLTGWLSEKNVSFEVPRSFFNLSEEGTVPIGLHTPKGLIHFKNYMESEVLPRLQDTYSTNEFVKNLIKISNDKTPTRNTVTTLSLQGEDLLAKSGSPQAASNIQKFNDFRMFQAIKFQKDSKIPSIADAFYLYAQFCYMGKKGKKSLMVLFDDLNITLKKSFNEYIARLDHTDSTLELSIDEIKHWCAPLGGEWSNANYVLGTRKNEFGMYIQEKSADIQNYNDEVDDGINNIEDIYDVTGEIPEGVLQNPSKYTLVSSQNSEFISMNKQHVLIPILDSDNVTRILVNNNKTNLVLSFNDKGEITDISQEGEKVMDDEKLSRLKGLQLSVIINPETESKQIDVGIIETIIEQDQNCNN